MKTTITLNSKDIKEMIAEKYSVKTDSIVFRAWDSQQDGIYYQPPDCNFTFEINESK